MPKCNRINTTHSVGLPRDPIEYGRGLAAYCNYARCKAQSSGEMYVGYHGRPQCHGRHQEEGMSLVIKAQEVSFSTIGNIHSTPTNAKSQVVLELVNPITLWILWKRRCRRVFSNQTAHPIMLMQEIWSEVVATLKSQYDGLKGGSDGVERQRLAFIQQWSSSPFLESVGIHIRWNYRVPTCICI